MTWTDKITPRRASALGSYLADTYLPIRYGRASGSCVRLNSRGTRWLWADHAITGIDEVRLDGAKITGWVWANEIDANGLPIGVITLTEPPEATAALFATGRGKDITNPGEIAADALGISMAKFASDCARVGYIGGGSITEPITRQSLARQIADSFGAVFTPRAGICYPDLTSPIAVDIGPIRSQGKPAGEVVASFDYADGQPQQTVTLRARAGESEQVSLPWVQSQRVAVMVAKALAIERSGQLWQFELTKQSRRISAADAVSFSLAPFGAMTATVTQSTYDWSESTGAAQFRTDRAASAALVHQSSRFGADSASSVTITRTGDEFILTVLDPDSELPLSNAKCTLDERMTRYTDAAGKVTFPASAIGDGLPHRIKIEAEGVETFEVAV